MAGLEKEDRGRIDHRGNRPFRAAFLRPGALLLVALALDLLLAWLLLFDAAALSAAGFGGKGLGRRKRRQDDHADDHAPLHIG